MQAYLKQWSDFNQDVMVSAQKLADINTNLLKNLAQQKMDMVGIWVETTNKQIQTLTQAKRVQEVLEGETQLTEEFNQKVLNNYRSTLDVWDNAKNQLTDWTQDNLKTAEKWKPSLQTKS
jgi:biotin-(acetyl-CoA carboxylase) ligase